MSGLSPPARESPGRHPACVGVAAAEFVFPESRPSALLIKVARPRALRPLIIGMKEARPRPSKIETSLGPSLTWSDPCWALDLGALPILHGLSVLSRALAEMAVGQARSDRIDVSAERKLRPRENPELIERFGIDLVKITAEHEAMESLAAGPELAESRLRALLGSLQRKKYRDALLPADRRRSRALVAEFGAAAARRRFVLEFVPGRKEHGGPDPVRGSLRITVEGTAGRRLDMTSIPHVTIDDVEDRRFIGGSTRIAQTWTDAIRREAERGRRSFFEERRPHSHLFRQLDQSGLTALRRVSIQWSESALPFLLETEPQDVSESLKRVLLALEDRNVRRLLAEREVVRVDGGGAPVFLDLAQLGRVLELSLGRRRERPDVGAYLARMPVLAAATARGAPAAPLSGVRIFLAHHMTGEVLGLIAALRALGCRDLTCLFITYAGEAPPSYLDAVLDLPSEEFRALALVNVPTPGRVEGRYRLSTQYSRLEEAEAIGRALHGRDDHYLSAMRAAAIVPFVSQLARAEAARDRCLLIEDGGYLGPALQDALCRNLTCREFAAGMGHEIADERPLAVLAQGGRLGGLVEHTRNGFDRLAEVEARHGRLGLPAFSIAISRLKRDVESREVAAAILNAVETVLHAEGRILSRRSCLVLGSRGAIGLRLFEALQGRLEDAGRTVAGIDLAAPAHATGRAREARTLAELGDDAWLEVDLVLGVTGASVLSGGDVERRLLSGARPVLTLASGSTKKAEFSDVMTWLDALMQSREPKIGGRATSVVAEELLDPRTARVYGRRYVFAIDGVDGPRTLTCLAQLTPVNFLFYGVATELIDEVLAQLLTASLGLLARVGDPTLFPRLYAVDRDIDDHGRALH
jgi:hypothetical protein